MRCSGRHRGTPRSAVGRMSRSVFRGRHFHRSKAAMFSLVLCACGTGAQAQSAMWSASPGSNVWNNPSNWVPPTAVPTNTATFGASNTTSIAFLPFTVNSIGTLQFNPGAPAYTFTTFAPLFTSISITGAGIVNNSSSSPTFIVGSQANLLFSMRAPPVTPPSSPTPVVSLDSRTAPPAGLHASSPTPEANSTYPPCRLGG